MCDFNNYKYTDFETNFLTSCCYNNVYRNNMEIYHKIRNGLLRTLVYRNHDIPSFVLEYAIDAKMEVIHKMFLPHVEETWREYYNM